MMNQMAQTFLGVSVSSWRVFGLVLGFVFLVYVLYVFARDWRREQEDRECGTPVRKTVKVIKDYVPGRFVTDETDKTMGDIYVPDAYYLRFEIDGVDLCERVEEDFFNQVNDGDTLEYEYVLGGLTNEVLTGRFVLV